MLLGPFNRAHQSLEIRVFRTPKTPIHIGNLCAFAAVKGDEIRVYETRIASAIKGVHYGATIYHVRSLLTFSPWVFSMMESSTAHAGIVRSIASWKLRSCLFSRRLIWPRGLPSINVVFDSRLSKAASTVRSAVCFCPARCCSCSRRYFGSVRSRSALALSARAAVSRVSCASAAARSLSITSSAQSVA